MRRVRATAVLLVAALAFVPPASAQEGETETTGSATIGLQGMDDPNESSKFQEYRDIPSGFFLHHLNFGLQRGDLSFGLETTNLTEEDQRISATWTRTGSFRVWVGYDQTPRWISNTARTLFTPFGGRLVLPDPMQEDLEGLGSPAAGDELRRYLDAAHPVDLRFRRDTAFADVTWWPTENLTTRISATQDQKNGTYPISISTYFSTGADMTEFAAPLDWTTGNASAVAEYATDRWHAGAEVQVSRFTNDVNAAARSAFFENAWVVDNPLRLTDSATGGGGALFLVSAPPDNESAWLNLTGGMRVGDWGRVVAQASLGRNEQNEDFLPFSLNTAVAPPPEGLAILAGGGATSEEILLGGTPQGRYDGQVDLSLYTMRFSGRPLAWLDFELFARSYDYDNETPHYVVTDYIRADTGLEGIARGALPFAWQKDNLGADLRLTPWSRIGFTVRYEQERWDREFRSAPETTEDIVEVGADWRAARWGFFRASFRVGDRTHDRYSEELWVHESYPEGEPVGNAIFEPLRQFDMDERDQRRWDLLAQLTPSDSVGIGLTLSEVENDYEGLYGRTFDRHRGLAIDLSYMAGERLTLYADYGIDAVDLDMRSRYRPVVAGVAVDDPLNDWFTDIDDRTRQFGLGVSAEVVPDLWFWDLHGTYVKSEADFLNTFVPGGSPTGDAPAWPDVDNRLTFVATDLRYRPAQNMTIGVGYAYEDYDQSDWARDVMRPWMGNVDPTASESVFLGWRIPPYGVHLVRLLMTYSF